MDLFFCQPVGVKLSREGCAKRYGKAMELKRDSSRQSTEWHQHKVCVDCPTGKEHHEGKKPTHWASGRLIEITTIEPPKVEVPAPKPKVSLPVMTPKPLPVSRPAVTRKMEPEVTDRRPEPVKSPEPVKEVPPPVVEERKPGKAPGEPTKTLTHGGKTMTYREWSQVPEVAELGLTEAVLRKRKLDGWTPEQILTTPKSEHPVSKVKRTAPPEILRALDEISEQGGLTLREKDVLTALVQGIDRDQLTVFLDSKYNTVKSIIGSMIQKLGVPTSMDAVQRVLTWNKPTATSQASAPTILTTPDRVAELEEKVRLLAEENSALAAANKLLAAKSPETAKPSDDPELKVMALIVDLMKPLDKEACHRVLRWAISRWG